MGGSLTSKDGSKWSKIAASGTGRGTKCAQLTWTAVPLRDLGIEGNCRGEAPIAGMTNRGVQAEAMCLMRAKLSGLKSRSVTRRN